MMDFEKAIFALPFVNLFGREIICALGYKNSCEQLLSQYEGLLQYWVKQKKKDIDATLEECNSA